MKGDDETRTSCDYCGSVYTHCWDEPDAWVVKCLTCKSVDRIWKDNEDDES